MVGGKQRPSNVVANMCWDASRRHTYYIIYIYILYKFQTSLLDTRGRADFVKTCLTYVILTCSFLSDLIASITALQTTIPSFHESSQTCWPKSKTTGKSSRVHTQESSTEFLTKHMLSSLNSQLLGGYLMTLGKTRF